MTVKEKYLHTLSVNASLEADILKAREKGYSIRQLVEMGLDYLVILAKKGKQTQEQPNNMEF